MSNFIFEAAVPKYLRLTMQPATSTVLEPHNNGNASQTLSIVNSTNGERPIILKVRIGYVVNGAAIAEMAQVGNLPAGL